VFDRIQYMKDEIKVLREKREARKKKENDNAYYNLWKLVILLTYNYNKYILIIINNIFSKKKI